MYNGSVACARRNYAGQLGTGKVDSWQVSTFILATALAGINVSSVAVGDGYTCVLADPSQGNKVYCLGANGQGQLGNGSNVDSAAPVLVQGLKQSPRIAQLIVSGSNACVLFVGSGGVSAVQCWGWRVGVQANNTLSPQAVDVVGGDGAVSLAVGPYSACALFDNGTLSCWSPPLPLKAVQVPDVSNVVRVVVSTRTSCAILSSAGQPGSLWCWGANPYGVPSNSSAPLRVSGLPGNVVDVAVGLMHACALVDNSADRSGGDVFCWGANMYGQLGQGNYHQSKEKGDIGPILNTPTRVNRLSGVRALYSSNYSTCAVTASQQVVCWGYNGYGWLAVDPAEQVIGNEGIGVVPSPAILPGMCT